MDRGAWWATVHGVARVQHNLVTKQPSQSINTFRTQLDSTSNIYFLLSTNTHTHTHTSFKGEKKERRQIYKLMTYLTISNAVSEKMRT